MAVNSLDSAGAYDYIIIGAGVVFSGGGTRYTASASRGTVLAAGAIGSPQILQNSGIGAARCA